MGGSQSSNRIQQFQADYIQKVLQDHQFFGPHTILINKNSHQTIIKKQINFVNTQQLRQFMSAYEKAQKIPFNLIYPRAVYNKSEFQTCSNSHEVLIYYEFLQKNLGQVVQKHGNLSQVKIWFLLNEISRSLQILAQQKRAHWGLSPQTIYENNNKNWLIHDTYFIFGHDYQNFLLKKRKNTQFSSPAIMNSMEYGLGVNPNQGLDEDIYCLGYCILFAMTNKHPSCFCRDPIKRHVQAIDALHQKSIEYSTQLIKIIERMIEKSDSKRISLTKLRKNLKEKQIQIIHNDNEELISSQNTKYQNRKWGSNQRTLQTHTGKRTKHQTSSQTQMNSPPLFVNSPQRFTSPRKSEYVHSNFPNSPKMYTQYNQNSQNQHILRLNKQEKTTSIYNYAQLSPTYRRQRF